MNATDYAIRAGLMVSADAVKEARQQLWQVLEEAKKSSMPATPKSLDRLYLMPVPKLSADGSCSLVEELDPTPYDLGAVLGRSIETSVNLGVLNALVQKTAERTGADWVGVYQARSVGAGRALVKLAYRGLFSRAEFPLTEDFAKRSNNSAVGLSGRARVLNDLQAHLEAGGAYYKCDPKVQSEACVPVVTEAGELVGIVDAEASKPGFFTEPTLAWVVALALEAQAYFPS